MIIVSKHSQAAAHLAKASHSFHTLTSRDEPVIVLGVGTTLELWKEQIETMIYYCAAVWDKDEEEIVEVVYHAESKAAAQQAKDPLRRAMPNCTADAPRHVRDAATDYMANRIERIMLNAGSLAAIGCNVFRRGVKVQVIGEGAMTVAGKGYEITRRAKYSKMYVHVKKDGKESIVSATRLLHDFEHPSKQAIRNAARMAAIRITFRDFLTEPLQINKIWDWDILYPHLTESHNAAKESVTSGWTTSDYGRSAIPLGAEQRRIAKADTIAKSDAALPDGRDVRL